MEENKNYTTGKNNTYVSNTTLDASVENWQKFSFEQKILEQRMYVFVERHLSPIDKGIQSAHAVVEYSNKFSKNENFEVDGKFEGGFDTWDANPDIAKLNFVFSNADTKALKNLSPSVKRDTIFFF